MHIEYQQLNPAGDTKDKTNTQKILLLASTRIPPWIPVYNFHSASYVILYHYLDYAPSSVISLSCLKIRADVSLRRY